MFNGVGLRLAALNALVVIVVIALTGAITYALLLTRLDDEVDNALKGRIEAVTDGGFYPPPAASVPRGDDDVDVDDVLDSGDILLLGVDAQGTVVYNPRGVRTRGVPLQAGIDRALADEKDTRSVTLGRSIGSVRVMTRPVERDGQIVGAVQAMISLEQHDAELATVRMTSLAGAGLGVLVAVPAGFFLARRAMRPINAAFEQQRTFVADASHELRTPLTLIRANTELVRQTPAATVAAVEPELESILAEVDRTDRLVDDLLTLARVDAGRLSLAREPLDLAELVAEAAGTMRPLAQAGGVALKSEGGAGCRVVADRERIGQVVRILLDNAIKHTPGGGTVEVAVRCTGRQATVTVRDTGPGIAADEVPRVFDRFYRIDKARSRSAGGTGLGLPIAQALVKAHGGQIELTSVVGEGTTVTFSLPVEAGG